MTPQAATAALLEALATQDATLVNAALEAAQPALWAFNPNRATPAERELENAAHAAHAFTAEHCTTGRHLDDCSCPNR